MSLGKRLIGKSTWCGISSKIYYMLSFFEKMLGKKRWPKRLGGRCGFTPEEGRLRLAVVFIIWRPTILKMSVPNRSTNDIGASLTRTINICRGRIREIKCANQARAVFTDFRDGINHSQGTCLYAAHNMVTMRAGNSAI